MKNKLTFHTLHTNSPELSPALKLYVDTFQTESITSYNFNFEHPKTANQYLRAVQLMAKALIVKGDDILVANFEDSVVGVAVMNIQTKGAFSEMIKVLFPDVLNLYPLLTKINYRNLITSAKAMNLSTPLNGNYVTLQIIAISPNYQGQGFGKQFIQELHARYANDYDGIYLYTADETNKDIYEYFGYELLERTSNKDLEVYHLVFHF